MINSGYSGHEKLLLGEPGYRAIAKILGPLSQAALAGAEYVSQLVTMPKCKAQ